MSDFSSEAYDGMCCQIAFEQCMEIQTESKGTRGWEPTVCPHGPGAGKIIGNDPYRPGGGGGTHTNADAYNDYCKTKSGKQ